MKKSILKDTLSLVVITLVAALCLAVIYQVTKNTIAEAEAAERLESFRSVFPGDAAFVPMEEDLLNRWNEAHPGAELLQGYRAEESGGKLSGVVLSVVSHNGYGGDVVLSIGVYENGSISGVKVTSMSETSGLGANCQKEEWISQFAGKDALPIGFVKNGNPGESEIDAISGATVTTKAVLEAVNQGLAFAQDQLGIKKEGVVE